jgi:hypothetical protein
MTGTSTRLSLTSTSLSLPVLPPPFEIQAKIRVQAAPASPTGWCACETWRAGGVVYRLPEQKGTVTGVDWSFKEPISEFLLSFLNFHILFFASLPLSSSVGRARCTREVFFFSGEGEERRGGVGGAREGEGRESSFPPSLSPCETWTPSDPIRRVALRMSLSFLPFLFGAIFVSIRRALGVPMRSVSSRFDSFVSACWVLRVSPRSLTSTLCTLGSEGKNGTNLAQCTTPCHRALTRPVLGYA